MSLATISRYRAEIMGAAILWVILFHTSISLPGLLFLPVYYVKAIGYGAVDLFFFLSGFGLFYSWSSKNDTTTDFYKARLLRILPTYWIVVALYYAIEYFSKGTFAIVDLAYMATGLNFFVKNDKFFWFIPSIVLCYLLFPFLVRWVRFDTGSRHLSRNVTYAIAAMLLVSLVLTATGAFYLLIFTLRLPVFLLGMYAGYAYVRKQDLPLFENIKMNGLFLLVGLVCLELILSWTAPETRWRFGLWWYPFMLMAYPLCLMIALMCQRMNDYSAQHSFLERIRTFAAFCGVYSLELFLLHLVIFRTFPPIMSDIMPRALESRFNMGRIAEFSFYTLLALCAAPLLSKAGSFCTVSMTAARRNASR